MLASHGKRPRVGSVDTESSPAANPDTSPMSDAPPVYAYLYQLPQDSFSTTRMAFGPAGATPVEMGVFGTPQAAAALAATKGWRLAWDGVRQLQARPGS